MDWDLIFAIAFYALIFGYYFTHKKKFITQNKIFLLYKTKLGLGLMDRAARISRQLKYVGYFSVFLGFIGMGAIFIWLLKGLLNLVLVPGAKPTVGLLLPGVRIPGGFFVPFWYGIISIFIVAVLHEFSHGVFSRLFAIKIKSSGFAVVGPILAAFVEPNERELQKRKKIEQLSIFAAGPAANIYLGVVVYLLLLLLTPFASAMVDFQGVKIIDVEKGSPADLAGATKDEIIIDINGAQITTVENFTYWVGTIKTKDVVEISTDKNSYSITAGEHPTEEGRGYLGVTISPVETKIKSDYVNYGFLPWVFLWFVKLSMWVFMLSLGIGLVNLLPLGPVDGGRMFHTAMLVVFDEKKSKRLWKYASLLSLLLLLGNLFFPLIRWLVGFMF